MCATAESGYFFTKGDSFMKIDTNVAFLRSARLDREIDRATANSLIAKSGTGLFAAMVIFKLVPTFFSIAVTLLLFLVDLYYQYQKRIAEKQLKELYILMEKPLPETEQKRNLTLPYYIAMVCVMLWI